jgi:hypothetical protein
MLNSEQIKPTFVITVINDTILLATMLVGLFRLLPVGGYTFGLGRLLWKQVGSACSPFVVSSIDFAFNS